MSENRQSRIELARAGIGVTGAGLALLLPAGSSLAVSFAKILPTVLAAGVTLLFKTSLSTKRAKKIIEAARRNPDVTLEQMAVLIRTRSDRETIEREVRALFREIEDVVDSALVDPLFRVAQLRTANRLTRQESKKLTGLLRELDGQELGHLIQLMRSIINFGEPDPLNLHSLRLSKYARENLPDGTMKSGVGLLMTDKVVAEDVNGDRLFPLLKLHGFGSPIDGMAMSPNSNMEIYLHQARLILQVIDP